MRTKYKIIILLIVGAGVAFYGHNQLSKPQVQEMPPAPLPQVETIILKSTLTPQKIELSGRVVAYQSSQVRPQVSGIIEAQLFTEGTVVEKGQPLYRLDGARFKANLLSAKAGLQSAEAQYLTIQHREKRLQALGLSKSVSQQDLDDVEASLAVAKAQIEVANSAVELAELDIEYSQIKAPIRGRISQSLFTAGALVTANQAEHLAVITQLDPVYVDLQASQVALRQIQQALSTQETLTVSLNDGLTQEQGHISFADVNVDSSTGAVTIRSIFDNQDSILLPGMFVTAKVDLGEQNAVLIPQRAASRTPSGDLLVWFVDEQGQVYSQNIHALFAQDHYWVVNDVNLDQQQLVVTGYQRLQKGVQVNTADWHEVSKQSK